MLPYRTAGLLWRLRRNRKLSADELQDMRNRKLRLMIRHASERVPYYRELFASVGLTADDIRTTDDLHQIPVSRKEDLVAAGYDMLLVQGTDRDACSVSRTSGSMGVPFSTYFDGRERMTRRLLGTSRLIDTGLRPLDRVCVVSDPVQLSDSRFRTRCVSMTLPAQKQIELLQQIRPTVLKAMPSSLRMLMHSAEPRLGRYLQSRIVAVSGEECDEELRRGIESELAAEVFSFYAAGEFGPIASECRAHQGLHINADQLIVECLGDDADGGSGEIVITSLFAFTMPYIRYRIGDVGSLERTRCSCGCSFPRLMSVLGRMSNLIRLPEGRIRSVSAVVNTALRPFPTLLRFRLVQEALDRLVLQVSFLEPATEETIEDMKRRMLKCLGDEITVEIAVVDAFEEVGAYKFANFVSRLPGSA